MLVNGFSGLGVHTVLSVQNLFPHQYKSYVFVSVGVIDSSNFKGRPRSRRSSARRSRTSRSTSTSRSGSASRRSTASRSGPRRSSRSSSSARSVRKEFPRSIFFLGQLVFENDRFYYRLLHNETAFAIQRRLQFAGLQAVVLPIRVLEPRSGRRRGAMRPRASVVRRRIAAQAPSSRGPRDDEASAAHLSSLRPQRPRHQPVDRLPRRHALVEHLHDGLGDRRLDCRRAAASRGTARHVRAPSATSGISTRIVRERRARGRSVRRRSGCATAGPCRSASGRRSRRGPGRVRAWPPCAHARSGRSRRGRASRAPRACCARSRGPDTMPAAIATTFLSAPASSTPDEVVRAVEPERRAREARPGASRPRARPRDGDDGRGRDPARATPSANVGPGERRDRRPRLALAHDLRHPPAACPARCPWPSTRTAGPRPDRGQAVEERLGTTRTGRRRGRRRRRRTPRRDRRRPRTRGGNRDAREPPRMPPVGLDARRRRTDRAPRAATSWPRRGRAGSRAPCPRIPRRGSRLLISVPAVCSVAAGEALQVLAVLQDDEHRRGRRGRRRPASARGRASRATGGSSTIATTEPRETYRVAATTATKTPTQTSVGSGASARNAPTAVATPLPPRNP